MRLRAMEVRERAADISERGILLLLILGVLVPVALVSAAGIVALAIGREVESLVIGILVLTGALAAVGAAIAILVMLHRRTRLARQQVAFVTNVTHELRTPLAAIRLHAQTLELGRAEEPEQRRECLEAILREADRLDRLVERVLQWRRIAEGRRIYELRAGDVGRALDEALDAFRALLRPGEVELKVDLRARRRVELDAHALADAVLNLLVNAHKYTGQRKEIALSSEDVDGGVTIAVRDNGIGIPKVEQETIFEPFHRVDERLRARGSGVGLGLAIVRDIVHAHRGRVAVASETGRGSTFTIFLPGAAETGGSS